MWVLCQFHAPEFKYAPRNPQEKLGDMGALELYFPAIEKYFGAPVIDEYYPIRQIVRSSVAAPLRTTRERFL
jgi:hypothetical protein